MNEKELTPIEKQNLQELREVAENFENRISCLENILYCFCKANRTLEHNIYELAMKHKEGVKYEGK